MNFGDGGLRKPVELYNHTEPLTKAVDTTAGIPACLHAVLFDAQLTLAMTQEYQGSITVKKYRFQLMAGILAACMAMGNAQAAKFVQPPIQDLFKERNQVTLLEFQSLDSKEKKASFKKVSDLWGELEEDEITLRVPKRWFERFEKGEQYIVGHSAFRKHPLLRDEIQRNPNGPSVIHPYVVDDAIFEDSKALRYLIGELQKEEGYDAEKVLSKNLDLLNNSTNNTRLLAAFQFQMSKPFFEEGLNKKHLKQLKSSITKSDLTPEEEEFLIRATNDFPESMYQDWVTDRCRAHIDNTPTPYNLQSFVPLLVKTCASVIGKHGDESDFKRLTNLLITNHPGVSKGALRALEVQAKDETPQLIATLLKDNPNLNNETHGILKTYLYEYALKKEEGQKYKY